MTVVHKTCGEEIEEWKDEKGQWHPYFAGYCPKCDIAVTRNEVKERVKNETINYCDMS